MRAPSLILAAVLSSLAGAPPATAQAGDAIDAARTAIEQAWEKEVQPRTESALVKVEVHAVQRRDRLAPGREIHLARALAQASWWQDSRHYLLLLGPAANGFDVLYRYDGGTRGKGVDVRLVDLGSGNRRFALEITDHDVGDDAGGAWTILVMHEPESAQFAEVFRELTSYRPASGHGYAGALAYRQAEGPMREIVVRVELIEEGRVADRAESIFAWREAAYQGALPLPEAWRDELPPELRRATGADPPAAPDTP